MTVNTQKTKPPKPVTLTLNAIQLKKLETLVQMDGSDRAKTMRKCIDFAFENPQDALSPRIS